MSSNVDKLWAEHQGRFTPEHLFAVTNLDHEEDKRRPVLVAGHHAEGFIFNKHYKIEYIGPNENSTPSQREALEKQQIKVAKQAVKDAKLKDVKEEKDEK